MKTKVTSLTLLFACILMGMATFQSAHAQQNALQMVAAVTPVSSAQQPVQRTTADEQIVRTRNAQTASVLQALHLGDAGYLHSVLAPGRQDRGVADLTRLISLYTEAYGPITSYVVQGSFPLPKGNAYTYVKVHFEDHTAHFRLSWLNNRLFALNRTRSQTFAIALAEQQ